LKEKWTGLLLTESLSDSAVDQKAFLYQEK